MSGHSKWSKVKHQKAGTDAVKSAAFTRISRGITIAVREGGGITDPEKNYHLRLAIEKAREVNMPKDTIDRAIVRASGGDAGSFERLTYEGFGPGGSAFIIEAQTDNRARTVSQIKYVLEKNKASLSTPGSVKYLFQTKMQLDPSVEAKVRELVSELENLEDITSVQTNV
ncbi:hypothetical protein A3A79_00645 [Candidatus Gottesmanbacteria bacterium RIFCSPLOWO2_01_FULL_43_11b]|uniref:Transcriptional regulator n=1 Tax=Candidatus Gottesmanbacteria bacterium RIFCSPLOWO2_01_FULL_43_11b TaxID=1798392 RepID=A0A1F6AGY5_9BACT|nr:MAG: hypothetical protein A3A79_00645 [Candidatus Gottesmanbacteria bacterium RIFCSPLOWO2_01_FULL_43_11b]